MLLVTNEWLSLYPCMLVSCITCTGLTFRLWCVHMLLSAACFSFMQYIVESARQRPAKRRISSGGRKSLYQKLYELYIEECEKEPELKVCVMHCDKSLIMTEETGLFCKDLWRWCTVYVFLTKCHCFVSRLLSICELRCWVLLLSKVQSNYIVFNHLPLLCVMNFQIIQLTQRLMEVIWAKNRKWPMHNTWIVVKEDFANFKRMFMLSLCRTWGGMWIYWRSWCLRSHCHVWWSTCTLGMMATL